MDAGEADTPVCRLFGPSTFLLLIAPGNGLSPPPPWDSLFPGFFFLRFSARKRSAGTHSRRCETTARIGFDQGLQFFRIGCWRSGKRCKAARGSAFWFARGVLLFQGRTYLFFVFFLQGEFL
jgi:hypothetical protein